MMNKLVSVSTKGTICLTALCFALSATAQKQPLPSASSVKSYGHLPLAFERNVGQTDSRVKYLSRGKGYTLHITPNEAVLTMRRTASPDTANKHKRPSTPTSTSSTTVKMKLLGSNPNPKEMTSNKLLGVTNYFIGKDKSKWKTGVSNFGKVGFQNVYEGIDLVYYGNQRNLEYDFVVQPNASPSSIRFKFTGANTLKQTAHGDLTVNTDKGNLTWHAPIAYQTDKGQRTPVPAKYILKSTGEVAFKVGNYDKSKPLIIDPELVYSTYLGGSSGETGADIVVDKSGNAYIVGTTSSTDFPATTGVLNRSTFDVFVTKLSADGTSVIYSDYLGGGGYDCGSSIAIDTAGNAYITGTTLSTNFPVTDGAFQTANHATSDTTFVTKLSADGKSLVYSTYLGGSSNKFDADNWSGNFAYFGEESYSIKVDNKGSAYVTGYTGSLDFPVTKGAFQTKLVAPYSAFTTKFSADGKSLVYSTLLGGSGYTMLHKLNMSEWDYNYGGDVVRSMDIDSSGNAYVTGSTTSTDFPTTTGAFQTTYNSGIGTSSRASEAFITKISADGKSLVYSTYLGGGGEAGANGGTSDGTAIAVDSKGSVYITGGTLSDFFPITQDAFQPTHLRRSYSTFVAKLNMDGQPPVYSTYLGSPNAYSQSIKVNTKGNAYIVGGTQDPYFPTTQGAFQVTYSGGGEGSTNVFVTKLSATGKSLVNSTFLGGEGDDYVGNIALDSAGNAYIVGTTYSSNFPTSAGAFQTINKGYDDAFVTKLTMAPVGGKVDTVLTVTPATAETLGNALLSGFLKRKADNAVLNFKPITFKLDGKVVGSSYTYTGGKHFTDGGKASFQLYTDSSYALGDHTITMEFAGDGNNNASKATSILTITKASTYTAINPKDASAKYGSALRLQASLSSKQSVLSNKLMTFKIDGTTIGTATTDGTGTAILKYVLSDAFAVGAHNLTADFAGDSTYKASTRDTTLTFLQTQTGLSVKGDKARIGETKNLSATLTRKTDKAGVQGRTVTFSLAGTQIGSANTDASGVATLSYKIDESVGVGKITLKADFAGDTQYIVSTGNNTLTVSQSLTKLVAANASGKAGTKVTLSGTLTRNSDNAPLKGKTVHFQIDGADIGSATTDDKGVATLSYTIPSTATTGKHTIKEVFDGDTLYTSTNNTATLTVK